MTTPQPPRTFHSYEPRLGHGLPHDPFNAIVGPRPIGWISTRGSIGANLAPYSFFNAVAYEPPQVMFASTGAKDSLRNLRETGVFCVNIVGEAQFHAMSETSATVAPEVSEFRAFRSLCPRIRSRIGLVADPLLDGWGCPEYITCVRTVRAGG